MPSILEHLVKSRSRRVPRTVANLLKHAEVSSDEAVDAARRLTRSRQDRAIRYGTGSVVGAMTYPIVDTIADAAGAFAGAKGGVGARLEAAGAKVMKDKAQRAAKTVTKGALTGSAVQALREHVNSIPDEKRVREFITQHTGG
jgi:hypothetical protein